MTHPAYLMARLNAKNARFDIGSGGISELTPQDVAAALAFVPKGIGRELLCRAWWPAGAEMQAGELDRQLLQAQLEEWNGREKAMFSAMGMVASQSNKAELLLARRAYAKAHRERWPKWITKLDPIEVSSGYANIRRTVLEEVMHPRDCPPCHGRGHLNADGVVRKCDRCDGLGFVKYGPTWRSRRIGVKESTYRQTWEDPYEWMYRLVRDELSLAEHLLEKKTS